MIKTAFQKTLGLVHLRSQNASIAALVKQLRNETGSPMIQCKKALEENDLDIQKAKDYLKKKGLSSANKYQQKETREGIVGIKVSQDSKDAALMELNCQTDFVARTDAFLKFSNVFLDSILAQNSGKNFEINSEAEIDSFCEENVLVDQVLPQANKDEKLSEVKKYLIAHLQENINLRRFAHLSAQQGLFGSYVHNTLANGIGLKSCLVELEVQNELSAENQKILKELADNIALQILGNKPIYITKSEIPQDVLEKEYSDIKAQFGSRLEGKPEKIQNNMIEGKMKKFYEDNVLYSQAYIFDEDENSMEKYISDIEKQINDTISIKRHYQWALQ